MSKKRPKTRAARQTARGRKKNKITPALESLETRQMLSAATAFLEYGGRLVVRGTDQNDHIVISADSADPAKIQASVNGRDWDFPASWVKQVKVEAGAGNDVVRSDASHGPVKAPMFFLGAAGNDTLVAPTGDDCIIGGYGNDTLVATAGNNYVDTGPGDDHSYSGMGRDTIVGDGGRDFVQDAGGSNVLQGIASGSTIITKALPATIVGISTGAPQAPSGTGPTPVPAPTPQPAPAPTPAPATSSPAPAASSPAPFVIGVWSQPTYSFDKWKGRGINTVVGYESLGGKVSIKQFSDAASARGLYMIRHPDAGNPRNDLTYKNLLAWMQNDEPDYHNTPADQLVAEYKTLKSADPHKPVFVNFSGSSALWGYGGKTQADYQKWMAGADWIGNDLYPLTAHNRASALDAPGLAVERLAAWSGGKRQFAVIEASDQELPGRQQPYPGVTPAQFRAEVFNAIVSGATGIIYFPQRIGSGFLYDFMQPDVEAEMKSVNARLARIGPALMTVPNPSGHTIDVDAPLRATSRRYNGKTYFIVINNSSQAVAAVMDVKTSATSVSVDGENRTLSVSSGQIRDSFKPYEAHVYVA